MRDFLSISELDRELGVSENRARREVDRSGAVIPRIGAGMRLVPRSLIPTLKERIAADRRLSTGA